MSNRIYGKRQRQAAKRELAVISIALLILIGIYSVMAKFDMAVIEEEAGKTFNHNQGVQL